MGLKIKIFLIISCTAMSSNEFSTHEYFDQLETIEYRLHNGQRDETVYINASSFVDWAYFSFETNSEVNIVDPETLVFKVLVLLATVISAQKFLTTVNFNCAIYF